MQRDGGCILRNVQHRGGTLDTLGVVAQADHLLSRSNAATYGDSRLVVCVCRACHAWKSLGDNPREAEYDALVRTIPPSERLKQWEACEQDSWRQVMTSAYDRKLTEVASQTGLGAILVSPPT